MLTPTKLHHHCRIPEKYQKRLINLYLTNMTLKIMQHVKKKKLLYSSKKFASVFSASEVAVVLLSVIKTTMFELEQTMKMYENSLRDS